MNREKLMNLGLEKVANKKHLAAGGLLGAGLGAAGMNLKRKKDLKGKNKQIIKAMQNSGLPTMADLKNNGKTVDDFNILPSDVADSYSPKGGVPIGEDTFGEVYRANYKKDNIPVSKEGKEVSPSIEDFKKRLTKESMKKIAFNPERGAFEGGAIAKGFIDKAKKSSGSSSLPDFAKNLKPSKVKSFAEANKSLAEIIREKAGK